MYSRLEEEYGMNLRAFRIRVGAIDTALLGYFEENWFNCKNKWSNVGRSSTFSGGNSTTNLVESNWIQIKAIIGDKIGIDRCVSALLQHQLTVYRKLQASLALVGAFSRTFIGVPYFMRPVAEA